MKFFCALSVEGGTVKYQWRPALEDWRPFVHNSIYTTSWLLKDDEDRPEKLKRLGYIIHDCMMCKHKIRCLVDSTAPQLYDPAQK